MSSLLLFDALNRTSSSSAAAGAAVVTRAR
jgi:hypothetical protein